MKIKFTKMHGAGNDFVVIDATQQAIKLKLDELKPAHWQRIADRRFGIGADQILVVEKTTLPGVDFRYRIYNADGGEVEQCGNGARAFVRFVYEKGLSERLSISETVTIRLETLTGIIEQRLEADTIRVETLAGIIEPRLEADGKISVDMGAPVLTPALVPFDNGALLGKVVGDDTLWPLDIAGKTVWLSVVSMGNPHAVQQVADVDAAPVAIDGALIEHHPRFPKRVNAGFMQIIDRQQIRLRVFERGAGETLACGTGACAAVVAGIRQGWLSSPVTVETRGGTLHIAWNGEQVTLSGPAVTVFEGEIEI